MSLLSRAGVQYKTIILKKITKLPPFSEILPYDQLVPRAWFFLISVLLSKIYVSYYCIYRDSLCETSLHSRTLLCVSLAVLPAEVCHRLQLAGAVHQHSPVYRYPITVI